MKTSGGVSTFKGAQPGRRSQNPEYGTLLFRNPPNLIGSGQAKSKGNVFTGEENCKAHSSYLKSCS